MSALLFTLISPVRKTLRVSSASTSALIFLFNTEGILVWMVWEHTEAEISMQKVFWGYLGNNICEDGVKEAGL